MSNAPKLHNGRWSAYRMLLVVRMKEMFREPEAIFWTFLFPVLLALGLGIAFRDKQPDPAHIVIAEQQGADRIAALLKSAPHAERLKVELQDPPAAANSFRLGKADLEVVPNPNGSVEYVYDPARAESMLAHALADDALQSAAGRKPAVETNSRINAEPGSRYIDFLIPGLIGMNLMGSGMWGVGFALVEMRQRKLLKRYIATPMRRSDFMLALGSSRMLLMFVELGLVLGFGILFFHLPVAGSWLSIVALSGAGALTFAALGLLTASRAQKIETVSGIMNVIMMPMWIFSGIFFSYERFPKLILPLIRALPLTALNDALRAVILEGRPLTAQAARLAVLAVWGVVSFFFAVRWFRWN